MHRFTRTFALCVAALFFGGCAGTATLGTWVSETRESVASRLSTDQGATDVQTQERFDAAVGLLRAGDAKSAEAAFEEIAADAPGLAGPHLNLALIRLADGRTEAAGESIREALRLNERSAPAHNALGIVLRRQGEFTAAESAYRRATEADPGYALAWRNLGVLYDLYLQRPHEALGAYRRYQSLASEPDKQVAMWITDLSRRHGDGARSARVESQ